MKNKLIANILLVAALLLTINVNAQAAEMDAESKSSFDTVMAFMGAVGSGDMDTVVALMADDMIWQTTRFDRRRWKW